MQKATSVVLGALVIVVTGIIIWWSGPRRRPHSVVAAPPSTPPVALSPSSSASPRESASLSWLDEPLFSAGQPGGAGQTLLDGRRPPALPADAPSSVRFGVVLIQYRGAQRAPIHARSKAEALELAQALAKIAQSDFKAAVDKGDTGSAENAGRIGVNVLEPAPNYVLFSQPTGGVGGPVDTPTGYWIVKNLGK